MAYCGLSERLRIAKAYRQHDPPTQYSTDDDSYTPPLTMNECNRRPISLRPIVVTIVKPQRQCQGNESGNYCG